MNTTFRPGFRGGRRDERSQPKEKFRINDQIIARQVRVISDTGEQLGVLATRDAIAAAEAVEMDLVEVSPNTDPPVCRIMNYGKFKYKQQKKDAEAKKNRSETSIKELRLRYRTDVGDLETKLKHARDFLAEGNKVKFTMFFKGREVMYRDLGMEKLKVIIERLSDVAAIEDRSPPVGNQMYIIFMPAKK